MIVTDVPTAIAENSVRSPKGSGRMTEHSMRSQISSIGMAESSLRSQMRSYGMASPRQNLKNVDNRDDQPSTSTRIKDDDVLVNLAMADLMAYLQVVANNSNNLPITRRDDPELKRMVTTLTSEDYARKSAAFIPADVRIISGAFTKYGKVWDLPTSEEYVASDGAQEPGRSYGGACTNSMLKVLYDAATEAAADAARVRNGPESSLFDDDDEESLGTIPFARNSTFASLDVKSLSNPSTVTWANLLRKMKTEINDIEYAQVPTIGSTRKFDLNTSFSLIPEKFDKRTGKKRSLFIGCNYGDIHGAELKASHDDIFSMKDYVVNVHGFPENEDMMTVLLDDKKHEPPTFMNIVEAFKSLSEQSQPGDAVFVHFSGHGGRILDAPINKAVESYDEILVPSDYTDSGVIRDTLIFKTLLAPMRYGVTVTIVIDCCDTGMRLDLPYHWSTRSDKSGSVAKMKQSEDFSFVRFLKVVKTLYESSVFTQLGRTVGTALGQQPVIQEATSEEEGSTIIRDRNADAAAPIQRTKTEDMGSEGGTFFQNLCCQQVVEKSACHQIVEKNACSDKVLAKKENDALAIIEKMFGCNFLVQDIDDDEFSFDDEYTDSKAYTWDGDTMNASTFDTMSTTGYRRHARRSHRKSR